MKYVEYGKEVMNIFVEKVKGLKNERSRFSEKLTEYTNQLDELGYVIIPDYYSKENCQQIIQQLDGLFVKYEEKVWKDKFDSDKRLFAADRVSPLIKEFYTDSFINQVKDSFYELKKITGFTLAARIDATKGNLGSGQGWHRDAVYGKQLKAILYLTDVSPGNGPFQFIPKTHSTSSKLDTILNAEIKAGQNRLDEEIVDKVISLPDYNLKECAYKAGTLLLINTTAIHRGKPIEIGNRYALTNYWFINSIPKHIAKLLVQ